MKNIDKQVQGSFLTYGGERYYKIDNIDEMEPFFMSIVSNSDHWLFISSRGGLSAGRVDSANALFPYIPVDRIHESHPHTGSKTLIRIKSKSSTKLWEPFLFQDVPSFNITCNLYKNSLGNKICFEEINHDISLTFRYTYKSSEEYGFIKECELEYFGEDEVNIEILDGFQNILPFGAENDLQNSASNLLDAYKWSELDVDTNLAFYTLYSGITDKPEPFEVLKANTVFSIGLEDEKVFLHSSILKEFRRENKLNHSNHTRGARGAYFVHSICNLTKNGKKSWQLIANLAQSQSKILDIKNQILDNQDTLYKRINDSIKNGDDSLHYLMQSVDGFQLTAKETVITHHYANVLFNAMRGGLYIHQYKVFKDDFLNTILHFNKTTYTKNKKLLEGLCDILIYKDLLEIIEKTNDVQLYRLTLEYLPLSFGRRHGDPSRPWNKFAIHLKDDKGNPILNYQGNWRDIFQNWEALNFSYPEFIEGTIAKFVNASTIDGYNPYRIEKNGIDWEVEDENDPWSYIGYWGDHQIIYLLKLLEQSKMFHPKNLKELLYKQCFTYANVPYHIKDVDTIFNNPKDTIKYNFELADKINSHVENIGADGKLILDQNKDVYLVNLLEKLLVPLLGKLSNFVIDGGIWMNTQRPEWNDANNALVGNGISMVTLYYIRRYIAFLENLLEDENDTFTLSHEVKIWLEKTSNILNNALKKTSENILSNEERYLILYDLGKVASEYRKTVYSQEGFSNLVETDMKIVKNLLTNVKQLLDRTIKNNKKEDGLYHAYNLLTLDNKNAKVSNLYTMLEGQVAVLSSKVLNASEVIKTLDELFKSNLYRDDLGTFLLYPDRETSGFLEKNSFSKDEIKNIELLTEMLDKNDTQIVLEDINGNIRFNPNIINKESLEKTIKKLNPKYNDLVCNSKTLILELFEKTYNHKEFTGRSGGMFGFEGLGCTYWHMVSKLLLSVQECYFEAINNKESKENIKVLKDYYYKVRSGFGFDKTPELFGAFPMDPYSHTPRDLGAQQPGMTGSVKEEILTRFGELGIIVSDGIVSFSPTLLKIDEFLGESVSFNYYDTKNNKKTIEVNIDELAFTWGQIPIIYKLSLDGNELIQVFKVDGEIIQKDCNNLNTSNDIFSRNGKIEKIIYSIPKSYLS